MCAHTPQTSIFFFFWTFENSRVRQNECRISRHPTESGMRITYLLRQVYFPFFSKILTQFFWRIHPKNLFHYYILLISFVVVYLWMGILGELLPNLSIIEENKKKHFLTNTLKNEPNFSLSLIFVFKEIYIYILVV